MVTSQHKLPEKQAQVDKQLGLVPYIDISKSNNKILTMRNIFIDVLDENFLEMERFGSFLKKYFKENKIDISDIIWTKFEKNIFYIKCNDYKDWEFIEKKFAINISIIKKWAIEKIIAKKSYYDEILEIKAKNKWKQVENKSLESIEKRSENISSAIEYILDENSFLWKSVWDIDDDDVLETSEFWKDLKYKNISELNELLNFENQKLYDIYNIKKETKKYAKLIKKDIDLSVWYKDKKSWVSRYLSLSKEWVEHKKESEEIDINLSYKAEKSINEKAKRAVDNMDVRESLLFIKEVNEDIKYNWHKSKLVKQASTTLVESLYKHTFSKMKEENSPNKYFIIFIKLITGRDLKIWEWRDLWLAGVWLHWTTIDMDFERPAIAQEALNFIIDRKNWLIDVINKKKKKEFKLEDKEIWNKTPQDIVDETIMAFNKLEENKIKKIGWNKNIINNNNSKIKKSYWENLINNAWEEYAKIINTNKSYSELSFDEKVAIWSLARITKIINSPNNFDKVDDPSFVMNEFRNTVVETHWNLVWQTTDFFQSFTEFYDLNWADSKDLWLILESAEIFDLYQEINWVWLFDLTDKNLNKITPKTSTTIILWVSLLAGWLILWTAFRAINIALLEARLGATIAWETVSFGQTTWIILKNGIIPSLNFTTSVWIISQVLWEQWFDSFDDFLDEAWISTLKTLWVEVTVWTILTLAVMVFLKTKFKVISTDFAFSKEAWKIPWLTEKWFILLEVLILSLLANPYIAQSMEEMFPENYFNPDNWETYHQVMEEKKY